jgi:tellurium resistance protein TerD
MSVSLVKGQKVDLHKASADAGVTTPLTKLVAGAGWDAKADRAIDLDLLTVLIGSDGKAIPDANNNGSNLDEAVTFFNNKDGVPGVKHSGDNLTGEGDGDDETIVLELANIPAVATEVAVVVASYSGEKFSEIENAFIRLVNADGNVELAKFELKDGMGDTKGVELGRIKRQGSEWHFEATGKNIDGDFTAIVSSYGVTGL